MIDNAYAVQVHDRPQRSRAVELFRVLSADCDILQLGNLAGSPRFVSYLPPTMVGSRGAFASKYL
jgi:hypothetical protein